MSCYTLAQVAEQSGHHTAVHASGADCHVPGCCLCGEYGCATCEWPDCAPDHAAGQCANPARYAWSEGWFKGRNAAQHAEPGHTPRVPDEFTGTPTAYRTGWVAGFRAMPVRAWGLDRFGGLAVDPDAPDLPF